MNKRLYVFMSVVVMLLTLSCGNSATHETKKRVITVTVEPLRYMTERIAGDRFDVSTMVPQGGNPETYEPTARQMIDLSNSVLYIKVGNIGFERTWMDKLKENAPDAVVIDSSDGTAYMSSENGIPDPHTWMSTVNARIIATNIYHALVEIDDADSTYFKSNLDALLDSISDVESRIKNVLRDVETPSFLIYHPILTYYARDFGLKQIPLEEEGREPSARQMQGIISRAVNDGVKVFFVQKEFANRNVTAVAESTRAQQVQIDPLGYDWLDEMLRIAGCLK